MGMGDGASNILAVEPPGDRRKRVGTDARDGGRGGRGHGLGRRRGLAARAARADERERGQREEESAHRTECPALPKPPLWEALRDPVQLAWAQ